MQRTIPLPDIAHDAAAIASAVRKQNQHRHGADAVGNQGEGALEEGHVFRMKDGRGEGWKERPSALFSSHPPTPLLNHPADDNRKPGAGGFTEPGSDFFHQMIPGREITPVIMECKLLVMRKKIAHNTEITGCQIRPTHFIVIRPCTLMGLIYRVFIRVYRRIHHHKTAMGA